MFQLVMMILNFDNIQRSTEEEDSIDEQIGIDDEDGFNRLVDVNSEENKSR